MAQNDDEDDHDLYVCENTSDTYDYEICTNKISKHN